MSCPICKIRKGKRFCPAKVESICSLCCGTEREVTIDCPTNCPFLVESRDYDFRRRTLKRDDLPFADTVVPNSLLTENESLIAELSYTICRFAKGKPHLIDFDVINCTEALAKTHHTLQSGLYYEQRPTSALQRELYDVLVESLRIFQERGAQQGSVVRNNTSNFEKILIFLTQLGAARSNGRTKSRAFLDFLRLNFGKEVTANQASSIVIPG